VTLILRASCVYPWICKNS